MPDQTFRAAVIRFSNRIRANHLGINIMLCAAALGALATSRSLGAIATWNTDSSGLWTTTSNWSTGTVPGSTDDVVIDRPSATPTITLSNLATNSTINSLLADDPLSVGANASLFVTTAVQLNNTLEVSASTNNASGDYLNAGSISAGAGGQIIVDAGVPHITPGITITTSSFNVPVTLNSGSTLSLSSASAFSSPITATGAAIYLGGNVFLSDIAAISGSGNTITMAGGLNNAGNTLTLNASLGAWQFGSGSPGAVITGGTINGAPLSIIHSGTLDGVTLASATTFTGGSLGVSDGLTLSGVTFNLGQGQLLFGGQQVQKETIGGTGLILMNSIGTQVLLSSPLTIGSGITIQGQGSINTNGQTLVNMGTIIANSYFSTLTISNLASGGFTNQGTLGVAPDSTLSIEITPGWSNTGVIQVNGGTLILAGAFNQSSLGSLQYNSGSVIVEGTISNIGNTLALSSSTGSWNLSGATLDGGSVTASGGAQLVVSNSTLEGGVLTNAAVSVPAGSTMTVIGGLTDNSTITLAGQSSNTSNLLFSGSQTLGGTGHVVMNSGGYNFVQPLSGTLTIGPNMTVLTGTGGGTVGSTTAGTGVVNEGTLSAQTASNSLTIAGAFTNVGLVSASEGGTVTLNSGALANLSNGVLSGGSWSVSAGSTLNFGTTSITTNNATIALSGTNSSFPAINSISSNQGGFSILDGRNFIAGAFTNSGSLTIDADSKFSVTSLIESPASTLAMIIEGPGEAGLVSSSGSVNLNGTLSLSLADGYIPADGSVFTLLQGSSISGGFTSVDIEGVEGSGSFDLVYSPASVQIVFVPEPTASTLIAGGALLLLLCRPSRQPLASPMSVILCL